MPSCGDGIPPARAGKGEGECKRVGGDREEDEEGSIGARGLRVVGPSGDRASAFFCATVRQIFSAGSRFSFVEIRNDGDIVCREERGRGALIHGADRHSVSIVKDKDETIVG